MRPFLCRTILSFFLSTILIPSESISDISNKIEQPSWPTSADVVHIGFGFSPECQDEYEIWGIGVHRNEEVAVSNAFLDAQCTILWYVLYAEGGILNTEPQRQDFLSVADEFAKQETLKIFTPWVRETADQITPGTFTGEIKKKFHIVVDRCAVKSWLKEHSILAEISDPRSVMILPEVDVTENPIRILEQNPGARMAKTVLENCITATGAFELLELNRTLRPEILRSVSDPIGNESQNGSHWQYLMHESDIHIRYRIWFDTSLVDEQSMRKASVRLRAYEPITERQIGASTASSPLRPLSVSKQALVEEAVSYGARDIIDDIEFFLIKEIELGVEYVMVIFIADEVDQEKIKEVHDCFCGCAEAISRKMQIEAMTSRRIKCHAWVDGENIPNVHRLSRELRRCFQSDCSDWKVRVKNSIGKLLMAHIVAND
jgi:hypothetical protein